MDFKVKVKLQRGYRRSWHLYRKREIMKRTDETVKDTDKVDYTILNKLRFLFINGRCKSDALYIKKWSVKTEEYKELITSNVFHYDYNNYEELEKAFDNFLKDIRHLFQMESDKFIIINRLIIDEMGFVVGIDEEDERLNRKFEVNEIRSAFIPNDSSIEEELKIFFNQIYMSEDKYYLGYTKSKEVLQNSNFLCDFYKFYDVKEKEDNNE